MDKVEDSSVSHSLSQLGVKEKKVKGQLEIIISLYFRTQALGIKESPSDLHTAEEIFFFPQCS